VPRLKVAGLLVVAVVALFGAGLLIGRPASRADVELTMEPEMVKGGAMPRVTIVEFSDYQ
jgi:hypothetical protein